MIIFEGPDGGGKSTLAKKFAERTGRAIMNFPGPPASLERLRKRIAFIEEAPSLFAFVRVPQISELAYTRASCDPTLMDAGTLIASLFLLLETKRPIIVYCRATNAEDYVALSTLEEHDSPERMSKVIESADILVKIYDQIFMDIMERGHNRVIIFDRDQDDPETLIKTLTNDWTDT